MNFKIRPMNRFFLLLLPFLFLSCTEQSNTPMTGFWRAEMVVQDQEILPFTLEFKPDSSFVVFNADESVSITDIEFKGDSIFMSHPVFEGVFKGVYSKDKISGIFIKPSLNRITPFTMVAGKQDRFVNSNDAAHDIAGSWEMVFSPNVEGDQYVAKGIFKTDQNKATGTIITTTGDYRYLEGVVVGNELKLSTFDGAHAFLFKATVTDSTLQGVFYSETHWKEPFVGKRNDNYELPNANSLTYLKEGYSRVEFAFPMPNGDTLTLDSPLFKDKVAVIQIMGTFCPNCLDETKYFASYVKANPNPNIQFAALAFEYATTKEQAFAGIKRLDDRIGIPYPVALAQYGTDSKTDANQKLPMLNHVLSYPTTIIIDKKGEVRRIHTGFSGPATGEPYRLFKADFEAFLAELAAE